MLYEVITPPSRWSRVPATESRDPAFDRLFSVERFCGAAYPIDIPIQSIPFYSDAIIPSLRLVVCNTGNFAFSPYSVCLDAGLFEAARMLQHPR